jgi:hypothetical protein
MLALHALLVDLRKVLLRARGFQARAQSTTDPE